MRIGLGLPNFNESLRDGRRLVDIARRAEALGFSSVATIGRLAFPTFEEFVTLAAIAAVTERIGLMPDVMLTPARETILLAKQAATLDQISAGRLVLGIGVGGRTDDYAVTGYEFRQRGRRLDEQLEILHRAWRGEALPGSAWPVTPRPYDGQRVKLMFGGRADASVARVVKYGIGYTQGGGTPEALAAMIERVGVAWRATGRDGRPQFRALAYFVLGQERLAEAEANVLTYYGDYGKQVWANAIKTPDEARARVAAYRETGCDELLLFMTSPHPDQPERLAEAVLQPGR